MASGSGTGLDLGDSSRRNRSDVWQYFKKDGSRNVICTLCKGKFAYHGSTSNLRDHLQRSHSAVYTRDSGQPKIDSIMKVQKCSPARAKILDNLIVGLTVHDLRPARMVEGWGFQELMEYCEPGYTVPSRKHISKLMFDRYTSGKALLTDKLQSDTFSLSLTTDIWTSSSTEAYISLTCHFLISQENISSTIKEVLESYEIADRTVSSIVRDQGSNMRRATDLLQIEKGWAGVNCSAHILQLCISDGFKNNTSIDRALGAARKLVGHFHHSTLATAELYKQQSQMNMNQQKL
ncbi:E3 SUMO-protein ligase ZBED1-like [Dysidea avara]|uniref:E3 SUMO-protein ligase ZBED1-like n=1 Tax=Dysidea avara TaxID=196820 RepID=UPI00331D9BC6